MPEQTIDPAKANPGAAASVDEKTFGSKEPEPKAEPKASAEGAAAKGAEGGQPVVKPIELKLPEGSLLEAGAVERVKTLAKERGLSQEQAQELLDREHQVLASYAEGQKATLTKTMNAWVEELKGDKEVGGEKFKESSELAKRVIRRFGTEAFLKDLNESGFGNHPELVRTFVRIGKAMSADSWVTPGAMPAPKKSLAEALYGSETSKEE